MNIEEIKKELQSEGYTKFEIVSEAPGTFHADHTHDFILTHVVLAGEMMLNLEGTEHLLKEGDRYDIPRGDVHSVRIGLGGCKHLVATFE